MALTPVPDEHVATIVTTREMTERPRPAPVPPSPLQLVRWERPDGDRYRALFRRVGAPWLWFSRLVMEEAALRAILDDDSVHIYAVVDRNRVEVGMLELDFREPGQCELGFVGLVPEWTGKGQGGWLMRQALALAWRADVSRVWVHTCTLDHPSALGFYRRFGFTPIRRTVELFVDPRLIGALPGDSAPQIPCLGAASRR